MFADLFKFWETYVRVQFLSKGAVTPICIMAALWLPFEADMTINSKDHFFQLDAKCVS